MSLIIQEHKSSSYGPRTYFNAASADVTIAFAVDYNTAGEKLTKKAAGERFLHLDPSYGCVENARTLYKWMKKHNCKSVNVAGNGIYTWSKASITQEQVNSWIYEILSLVHQHLDIEKIVSGGQTGTDLAGGVAGYKLGIPTVMTLPQGFKMRFADGKDVCSSEYEIRGLVEKYVEILQGGNDG